MAVSLDTTATGTQANGSLGLTINLTVAAGADLALYVGIGLDGTGDFTPTAVTWNTTETLTLLTPNVPGGANNQNAYIYRLLNPTTGAHSVSITQNVSATSNECYCAVVWALQGVHQTVPEGTLVTDTGSAASISSVVTSESGGFVLDVGAVNSNPTVTIGGGHTQDINANVATSSGTMVVGGHADGAASVTMSWTWSGNQRTAQVAVPVKASGAAASYYYGGVNLPLEGVQ